MFTPPKATVYALALLFLPAVATAADDKKYISLSGLSVMLDDAESSTSIDGVRVMADVTTDAGAGFLGAVGFSSPDGFRTELEFGYRSADFDEAKNWLAPGYTIDRQATPVDGDISTWSVMSNGYFVFGERVRPYIGGGLGFARHTVKTVVDGASLTDEDKFVLAYQAMAGVSYPISVSSEIRLGYRYFGTADANFDGTKMSYDTHSVELGILFQY